MTRRGQEQITKSAKDLEALILRLCPDRRERTCALRSLEEAVEWSDRAIALGPTRATQRRIANAKGE